MGRPSITQRKHFRLVPALFYRGYETLTSPQVPGEAEEPTSTIVLTSKSSHYVDVRIYKDQCQKEPDSAGEINSIAVLEWAFAGTSNTTEGFSGPGDAKHLHSVWEHWIDSNSDDPRPDEGDMWPQCNGDVLERGTQIDPITGLQTEYEELWGDLKAEKVGEEKEHVSIVLRIENHEPRTRGLVVRVGDWCQGIMKSKGTLNIERWRWVKAKNNWERVVKIGSGDLPCAIACNSHMVGEKSTIVSGDLEWNVVEKSSW